MHLYRISIALLVLLLFAPPAVAGGCKAAVKKETQAWLESCRADCGNKLTCGCKVTAEFRKGAIYWPSCLAAVTKLTLDPATVMRTWEGHWIHKGVDPDAPSGKGAAPSGDGTFKDPPPQILANCEIGFSFSTETGGSYHFWQENAAELKPSAWKGACTDGESLKSLSQATGQGTVDFGSSGSEFSGEFRDGKAWNGRGTFWSRKGFKFEGELRNGKPWSGAETSRFAPDENREYRNGVATKAVVKEADVAARRGESLQPKCAELGGSYTGKNEAACWQEIQSQPGCYIWCPWWQTGVVWDWSGPCVDGLGSGRGTFDIEGLKTGLSSMTGSLRNGKMHGPWTTTWANGSRREGGYRDGKMHGRHTTTSVDGSRHEGGYRDGKAHGRHTTTWPDGGAWSCEFRDGKGVGVGSCRQH